MELCLCDEQCALKTTQGGTMQVAVLVLGFWELQSRLQDLWIPRYESELR